MPRVTLYSALSLALAGVAAVSACGPSLTTVHEGTVRFEHCYRLDLESSADPRQRSACWTLWLDSYTYGQSRDRIDYARRRLRALAGQDSEPPALRLAGERTPEQRQYYLVLPAPSSVHTTPPPIATAYQPTPAGSSDAGADASNGKAPPSDACAASCKSAWLSCDNSCAADASPSKAGADDACRCKADYGKCMRGCFE